MEAVMNVTMLKLNKSKSGIPYLWECGGKIKDRIRSTIISDKDMKKKVPLYSTASETRDCYKYAKIPVEMGDLIVKVFCDTDFRLSIILYRVNYITEELNSYNDSISSVAVCDIIDAYNNGAWENDNYLDYTKIINAALIQATRFSKDALFAKDVE